jgi:hypothetical protein
MSHDLQQLLDLLARNSGQPDAWILRKANAPDQKRAGPLGHERKYLYARLLHLDVRRSLLGHQLSSGMVFGEHRL